MHHLIRASLVMIAVAFFGGWTVLAQDKTPAPPKKPPPVEEDDPAPKKPPAVEEDDPAPKDKPKEDRPKVDKPKENPKEKPKDKPKEDKKEEPQDTPDEVTLKAYKLPTDPTGLLDFFHKRSVDRVDKEKLAALVKQLGEKKPETRDAAFRELVSYGLLAVPVLRIAANDLDDFETAAIARQCLGAMEPAQRVATVAAALHRLVESKASGATEVLLAYLPYAEDDSLFEEIKTTLTALGKRGDKADPALVQALQDPIPLRRAVAAEILCEIGGNDVRPALRKLLEDPKPNVRLRVALALTQFNDAEAVPVLIGLLSELPQEQTRNAEEYLVQLAGDWAVSTPRGDDEIARRLRREAWTAWWKATDGPVLLEEFRKRTLSDADRDKAMAHLAKLNDDSPEVREKALTELLALGNGAVPVLRQALNNPEVKARDRIERSLELLDKDSITPLPPVAARLIALRKPAGAAQALLNYLPLAEDDTMAEEVRNALAAVAMPGGKLDPVLVKTLSDKLPVRRSAAAEAICRTGDKEGRAEAQKLLKDEDASVRFQVAQAFLLARDKEAVPVMIALISEGSRDQAERAQGYLYQLADDKAPETPLGDNDDGRKKCRTAWETWWKDNAAKVDLAKLESTEHLLGYTVVIEQWNRFKGQGRVLEVDAKGKIRWQIENLGAPVDAQVVANGQHVIIGELNFNRISERDLKGNILWQHTINQPLSSQRLTNGNTFLVGRNQMMEVDREGKQVGNPINRPGNDIIAAQKMRNGQISLVTGSGQLVRMDATGKEVKTGRVAPLQYYNGGIDILPNDHAIVPLYNQNKVVETDSQGKEVWSASVNWPNSSRRLPNGNVLVASQQSARVVEIDRAGKVVWEYKDNVQPLRAYRR